MFVYVLLFISVYLSQNVHGQDLTHGVEDSIVEGIAKLRNLSPPYAKIEEPKNFERELYTLVHDDERYDFIIVGAGPAGATLAYRLSEVPTFKVLLLEAGEAEDEITQIPSVSFNLLSSKYNWGYLTTPQKNWCFGSNNRQCLLGMGKALGGSTAINGMLWARGNPKDYNLWEHQGNEGWSYEKVLPYFKKIVNADVKHYSSEHQGNGGKVNLENFHYETHATEYVLRAAKELQIPYVNYNTDKQLGIGHAQGTLMHGSRWSSARTYLAGMEKKSNLVIRTRSTVLRVLIDDEKKACGVQYLQNNTLYEAHAQKEVILSAGGFSTPKLLALSGIGRRNDLEKLGIQTLSNLNVGTPLRTHLNFPAIRVIFANSTLSPTNQKQEIIEYLRKGTGPMSAFSTDVIAFFKTNISKESGDYPDIELAFAPRRVSGGSGEDKLVVSISVVLLNPQSVGSVKLSSSDPLAPPLIDPNYLTDEDDLDLKTILAGIRIAQKFIKTKIFQKHGGALDPTPLPNCNHLHFDSDSYWTCAIQHQSICLSDPASTAKMGPDTDKEAVVDNRLRVYGIQNLRVVDNSVIPVSVRGHMMAPAYMIGEKGAEYLKMFWRTK